MHWHWHTQTHLHDFLIPAATFRKQFVNRDCTALRTFCTANQHSLMLKLKNCTFPRKQFPMGLQNFGIGGFPCKCCPNKWHCLDQARQTNRFHSFPTGMSLSYPGLALCVELWDVLLPTSVTCLSTPRIRTKTAATFQPAQQRIRFKPPFKTPTT